MAKKLQENRPGLLKRQGDVLARSDSLCRVSYAALDIARELAEIASHIAQLKADARAYVSGPNYNTLKDRLEKAHSSYH